MTEVTTKSCLISRYLVRIAMIMTVSMKQRLWRALLPAAGMPLVNRNHSRKDISQIPPKSKAKPTAKIPIEWIEKNITSIVIQPLTVAEKTLSPIWFQPGSMFAAMALRDMSQNPIKMMAN